MCWKYKMAKLMLDIAYQASILQNKTIIGSQLAY